MKKILICLTLLLISVTAIAASNNETDKPFPNPQFNNHYYLVSNQNINWEKLLLQNESLANADNVLFINPIEGVRSLTLSINNQSNSGNFGPSEYELKWKQIKNDNADLDTLELTGTPTKEGEFSVNINATSPISGKSATPQTLTITVGDGKPVVSQIPTQYLTTGMPYDLQLSKYIENYINSKGMVVTFDNFNPSDYNLRLENSDDGKVLLTGTPSQALEPTTINFSVKNEFGTSTGSFQLVIAPTPGHAPVVDPITDHTLTINTPFYLELAPLYVHDATTITMDTPLPTGLNLSQPTTGTFIISGTPTQTSSATDYSFTAANSSGSTTGKLNLSVSPSPPGLPNFKTIYDQTTTVGIPYSLNLLPEKINNTDSVSIAESTPLPNGLDFIVNSSNHAFIEGTPTATTTNTPITLIAKNAMGTAEKTFHISVIAKPSAPQVNTNIPDQTIAKGHEYTWQLAPQYVKNAANIELKNNIPPGLSLSQTNPGVWKLQGTPTQAGTFETTFTAKNDYGSTNGQFKITVTGKPVSTGIAGQTIPVGKSYQLPLSYPGPITNPDTQTDLSFSFSNFNPNDYGLSLTETNAQQQTWVLQGTPTKALPKQSITLTATNANGSTNIPFDFEIYGKPVITTIPDQTLKVGDTFSLTLTPTYINNIDGLPNSGINNLSSNVSNELSLKQEDGHWEIAGTVSTAMEKQLVTFSAFNQAGTTQGQFYLTVTAKDNRTHCPVGVPALTNQPSNYTYTDNSGTYQYTETGNSSFAGDKLYLRNASITNGKLSCGYQIPNNPYLGTNNYTIETDIGNDATFSDGTTTCNNIPLTDYSNPALHYCQVTLANK